jgi:hypothetical protein
MPNSQITLNLHDPRLFLPANSEPVIAWWDDYAGEVCYVHRMWIAADSFARTSMPVRWAALPTLAQLEAGQ